jgi:hypothetical protein
MVYSLLFDDLPVWQLMGANSLDVKETGTDNFGALSELPRANDLTFKTYSSNSLLVGTTNTYNGRGYQLMPDWQKKPKLMRNSSY